MAERKYEVLKTRGADLEEAHIKLMNMVNDFIDRWGYVPTGSVCMFYDEHEHRYKPYVAVQAMVRNETGVQNK